jgi:hypothetical protein
MTCSITISRFGGKELRVKLVIIDSMDNTFKQVGRRLLSPVLSTLPRSPQFGMVCDTNNVDH